MQIVAPPSLLARLRAAALAHAPREACGLVLGSGASEPGRAAAYRPLRNRAASPGDAFRIDVLEFLAADAEARAAGMHVLGVFHSHPSGDPRPSPTDLARPWPAPTAWIAAPRGHAVDLAVWERVAGGAPSRVPIRDR